MELYDVMRTTFAAREFTRDPLPDKVLDRILDNARFAPSGGNRQAGHVIVVKDPATRESLVEATKPGARRYFAQVVAGESPWNPISPTRVNPETIAATVVPESVSAPLRTAGAVLVVCVDLRLVAAVDQDLERVGVVAGASVYPLVWNILLAARQKVTAAPSPPWRWPRNRRCESSSGSPTPTLSPRCCRSVNRSNS